MIELRKYSIDSVSFEDWDGFVDQSNNGTIFHKASFFLYHDSPKPVDLFEFYYKNKKVASCIGAIQGKEFKSPFAASYGGICWAKSVRFAVQEAVLELLENELKTLGVRKITFVNAPITYQHYVDQSIDFLFHYRNYSQDQTLISAVINLEEFTLNSCSDLAKRNFKSSSSKNVTIRFESIKHLADSFGLLLKNKEKFNLKPTHSLSELQKLSELFPGKIEFVNAFIDDTMIGSVVNFIANSRTVLAFYISTDYEYNAFQAVNFILIHSALEYQKRGFKSYDLGVSMETDTDNPMDPRRSLIFFKEHFVARGQLRSRFVKKQF